MFIELDLPTSVISTLDALERQAIENLGQSLFRGRDYLFARSALAKVLSECTWLSESSAAAFKRLAASAAMTLPRPARHIIARQQLEIEEVGAAWVVPLRKFASQRLTTERELICEDLDDARYYILIAQTYLELKKLGGLAVSLKPINGGGSNTNRVIRQAVSRGDSFFAIVDSDQHSSAAPIGHVARTCKAELRDANAFQSLQVTSCRAVENLAPVSWVACTQTGRQFSGTVQVLIDADFHGLDELRKFGCLKVDLNICALQSDHPNSQGLIADIERLRVLNPTLPSACTGPCTGSCTIWQGLGTALPSQLCQSMGAVRRASVLGDLLQLSFISDLAQQVMEFGLSCRPTRV